MRILIVTHYFPPETGAPQARLSARAAADLAGAAVLLAYLRSPALLARHALQAEEAC